MKLSRSDPLLSGGLERSIVRSLLLQSLPPRDLEQGGTASRLDDSSIGLRTVLKLLLLSSMDTKPVSTCRTMSSSACSSQYVSQDEPWRFPRFQFWGNGILPSSIPLTRRIFRHQCNSKQDCHSNSLAYHPNTRCLTFAQDTQLALWRDSF